MMSLFCCKDTKNIVSRKIMNHYFARNRVKSHFAQNSDRKIVFISRGNVRKNNGFPRLIILIDVFQFLCILLWEDAELLLEAFGEILFLGKRCTSVEKTIKNTVVLLVFNLIFIYLQLLS